MRTAHPIRPVPGAGAALTEHDRRKAKLAQLEEQWKAEFANKVGAAGEREFADEGQYLGFRFMQELERGAI